MDPLTLDAAKVEKVIRSCQTEEQRDVAAQMIQNLRAKHPVYPRPKGVVDYLLEYRRVEGVATALYITLARLRD